MFGTENLMQVAVDWFIGIMLWKVINLMWEDGKWPFRK